jgi:hypothetical protein
MSSSSAPEVFKQHLAAPDSVMEPKVLDWIKECLAAGEQPPILLELLSDNYTGFAQMANLLYDWHMFLGDEELAIDREVRLHLKVYMLSISGFDFRDAHACAPPFDTNGPFHLQIQLPQGLITRDFDPQKADSVLQQTGSPPRWLEQMVLDPE